MLMLDNDVVKQILPIKACIESQERAFRGILTGNSVNRPRLDMYVPCDRPDGYYRSGNMEGAIADEGIYAIRLKSDIIVWPKDDLGNATEEKYCVRPGTYCGLVLLFSARNGEPLAIINDGHIQHMRVGGGAGIGAKYLSREDSQTVGMIGSGGMARVYLDAFCAVRPIKRVRIFSPTRANRERYAAEMRELHSIQVEAVDTPEQAICGADIVATCTDAMQPTIPAAALEPGQHLTNVGPSEIARDVFYRADVRVKLGVSSWPDSISQLDRVLVGRGHSPVAVVAGSPSEIARLPSGNEHPMGYDMKLPSFTDLLNGDVKGRTDAKEVTFWHNIGNHGLQFAAVGGWVYKRAKELGVGRVLPTEWFLQSIKN